MTSHDLRLELARPGASASVPAIGALDQICACVLEVLW
jgi:hypothetical protein